MGFDNEILKVASRREEVEMEHFLWLKSIPLKKACYLTWFKVKPFWTEDLKSQFWQCHKKFNAQ